MLDEHAVAHLNPWWADSAARSPVRHLPCRRSVYGDLFDRLTRVRGPRALLLLGPRQVGKTTLLYQLADDLLDRDVDPRDVVYVDFSDPVVESRMDGEDIYEQLYDLVGSGGAERKLVLFDEVSRLPKWELWLKQAVDREVARFLVTDSSAAVLRRERESGQGRWDEVILEGLTFGEFVALESKGVRGRASDASSGDPPRRRDLGRLVERYLLAGGFPEHLLQSPPVDLREGRLRLRNDIIDKAIFHDLGRTGVDVRRLRSFFVYLMQDSGAQYNESARSRDLDANRSTVSGWLDLLEDSLLVVGLNEFHRPRARARRRIQSRPKLFAADHGLVTAFATAPADDPDVRWRIFEAVVFRHLRSLIPDRFWRTRELITFARIDNDLEVDFVLSTQERIIAIEVTSSTRVEGKAERVARAAEAIEADAAWIVHGGVSSRDADAPARDLGNSVKGISIVDFLLTPRIVTREELDSEDGPD